MAPDRKSCDPSELGECLGSLCMHPGGIGRGDRSGHGHEDLGNLVGVCLRHEQRHAARASGRGRLHDEQDLLSLLDLPLPPVRARHPRYDADAGCARRCARRSRASRAAARGGALDRQTRRPLPRASRDLPSLEGARRGGRTGRGAASRMGDLETGVGNRGPCVDDDRSSLPGGGAEVLPACAASWASSDRPRRGSRTPSRPRWRRSRRAAPTAGDATRGASGSTPWLSGPAASRWWTSAVDGSPSSAPPARRWS